jgi:serine/threonine protein kinase
MIALGSQVLNYQIHQRLGDGGMGVVYLATHRKIGRKAAIKVLHPQFAQNPQIRQRFRNEAALLAQLDHPCVVKLYDYIEDEHGLCLIMEYVEGIDLDHYLKQVSGPIPEGRLVPLFNKILSAFDYAHQYGIVHRDIKPSNILITPNMGVKVLDFGIATIVNNAETALAAAGTRMGTVLYMSPEQVRGDFFDARSDIYSLGVTLFQMLTARHPYEDLHTEHQVFQKILQEPLPRAANFYPGVSAPMQQIIDIATAKNPDKRFPNCKAFAQAMRASQEQRFRIPSAAQTRPQPLPAWVGQAALAGLGVLLAAALWIGWGQEAWQNHYANTTARPNPTDQPVSSPDVSEPPHILAVKRRLEAFYAARETGDFEQVADFYAFPMERFMIYQNVRREEVRKVNDYYWSTRIKAEENIIDWDSFIYQQDEKGNHLVRVEVLYRCLLRAGNRWEEKREVRDLRLNPELRIYYIRSDELRTTADD